MPKSAVTIREVAQRAGVSPITASRALNRPELVHPETRSRVEKAAAALDYLPNLAAQTLTGQRSRMIGVIVPTLSNPIFADALQALSASLSNAGYQMLIGSNEYDLAAEERLIRTFIARRADALVLTGFRRTPAARSLLSTRRLPVVEIWNVRSKPEHYMVGVSHFAAARSMGLHLIARGHRRIAYLGGHLRNNDRAQARFRGFLDALARSGLAQDPALSFETDFTVDGGADGMGRILQHGQRPDAVFASSDVIALGAFFECQRRGLRIPDDLALAGFDDSPVAALIRPGLTTIRLPRHQIGTKAAEVVVALLKGEENIRKVHDLGYELVIRQSA
jgi:LacI family gluconate utilization system Gnt-I transcriptional repressor